MKAIEITFRIIGGLLTLVLGWGVVCPMLVSAKNDLLVVSGFITFFVVILITYLLVRPVYRAWKELVKQDKEKYF